MGIRGKQTLTICGVDLVETLGAELLTLVASPSPELRMTFDPAKVPGGEVAAWGAERRDKALSGVRDGDWRSIYDWTKRLPGCRLAGCGLR